MTIHDFELLLVHMMWRLRSTLLLLALLAPSVARAEWTVASSERSETGARGVVHVMTKADESGGAARASLHFAVFPMKSATLRVIDDPSESRLDLAGTMQKEGCIAGVNGGYFDLEWAPVGLLISDGHIVKPQRKARLLSGVVSVVNGRVQIQRAAEFSAKAKPSAARQCGPFLVYGGKAVPSLNGTRAARRTFVLTGGSDRAAIGYSSPVTLAQLGALLATPGVLAEMKIQRALNLDGGSSSGFWFRGERVPFSISEQKRVRDYLGVVAK